MAGRRWGDSTGAASRVRAARCVRPGVPVPAVGGPSPGWACAPRHTKYGGSTHAGLGIGRRRWSPGGLAAGGVAGGWVRVGGGSLPLGGRPRGRRQRLIEAGSRRDRGGTLQEALPAPDGCARRDIQSMAGRHRPGGGAWMAPGGWNPVGQVGGSWAGAMAPGRRTAPGGRRRAGSGATPGGGRTAGSGATPGGRRRAGSGATPRGRRTAGSGATAPARTNGRTVDRPYASPTAARSRASKKGRSSGGVGSSPVQSFGGWISTSGPIDAARDEHEGSAVHSSTAAPLV